MARLAAIAALVAVFTAAPVAQQPTGTTGMAPSAHVVLSPAQASWSPAPDGLPPGSEVAVLDGDPASTGQFTMLAKMPDGYRVPPHWHPTDEHLTVLEGTLLMGMGDQIVESSMQAMKPGAYAKMPQGVRHYVIAKGPTTIQIHGPGPFAINYVNASDDPRAKK